MIKPLANLLFWGLLAMSTVSFAHVPLKGVNSFYNGVLHPFLVPSHLLVLIAIGLLVGQQGIKENLLALEVFFAAAIGGLIMAWFSIYTDLQTYLLVLSAIIGLLVAACMVLGRLWCSVIAGVTGFFLGMDSAQEALQGRERLLALFGSGIGIYLLLLYPMGLTDHFRQRAWQKIGVRIIGSWVAASSFLVLALSYSSRQ